MTLDPKKNSWSVPSLLRLATHSAVAALAVQGGHARKLTQAAVSPLDAYAPTSGPVASRAAAAVASALAPEAPAPRASARSGAVLPPAPAPKFGDVIWQTPHLLQFADMKEFTFQSCDNASSEVVMKCIRTYDQSCFNRVSDDGRGVTWLVDGAAQLGTCVPSLRQFADEAGGVLKTCGINQCIDLDPATKHDGRGLLGASQQFIEGRSRLYRKESYVMDATKIFPAKILPSNP